MMTIDTTEMKNAIKTSTAFQESGIKRMTVVGFKIHTETEDCTRYQVAIRHKVLENGDNASVYEVAKHNDGKMHAYFNGTFRVSKDGVLESCWDVHYGSFTNEMAREWLSGLFNGDDKEIAQEMEAEVAETSTETPAESDEASETAPVTMKDVDTTVRSADDYVVTIASGIRRTARDLFVFEESIIKTGDEDLIRQFKACVRRLGRMEEMSEAMLGKLEDIEDFTRAESRRSC